MESFRESLDLALRDLALLIQSEGPAGPEFPLSAKVGLSLAAVFILGALLLLARELFGKKTVTTSLEFSAVPWTFTEKEPFSMEENSLPPQAPISETYRPTEPDASTHSRSTSDPIDLFGLLELANFVDTVNPAEPSARHTYNTPNEPIYRFDFVESITQDPIVIPQAEPARFYPLAEQTARVGTLQAFDELVNGLNLKSQRRKKRLVFANFESEDRDSTLHQFLTNNATLNQIICREMASKIDLIPHSAIASPRSQSRYDQEKLRHFMENMTKEYDEILVYDQTTRFKRWTHLFNLCGLHLELMAFPSPIEQPRKFIVRDRVLP